MKPLHIAFILLIDLLWAGNIVATKEAVMAMTPLLAVALRYMLMLAICAMQLKWVAGRMGMVLATGVVTGAVQFGLGAYSYQVANNLSALAIAGQLGVPLSLLMAILIDGERISWPRTVGIVLAFAGVALLVFDPAIANERMAILFTAGASLCWAAGNLMFKRLTGIPVFTLYAWQSLVSIPILLIASMWLEPGGLAALPDVPMGALGWVVYSAIGASLIGHAGMSWLVQRYPVTVITPLTLPTPLFAVALAVMVYGTPLTPMMWAGGAITLLGVAIITLRTARKSVEKSNALKGEDAGVS